MAPLIRAGCYVTLAGAGLGLLGVILPHPAEFNVAALVAVQAVMVVWALIFWLYANRLPMWTVQLAPAFGVFQTTAGVIFSGDPLSAYATFYLWPCLYSFYFLSPLNAASRSASSASATAARSCSWTSPPGANSGDLTHQFVAHRRQPRGRRADDDRRCAAWSTSSGRGSRPPPGPTCSPASSTSTASTRP